MLSVCDKSTFAYLSGLVFKFSELFSPELIFGLFISRSLTFGGVTEIELGKSATISPFEYKFFNPKDHFNSIKIEIENLKETQSKYNDINFTFSLNPEHSVEICNKGVRVLGC